MLQIGTQETLVAFKRVAALTEIPEGRGLCVRVGELEIGLYRVGEGYCAMDNVCPQKKMEWVRARRAKAASDWHDATEAEFSIPSTIGDEKATNPFMRLDSPAIIESVRKAHPASDADPVTILGHIRAMKDSF